MTVGWVKAYVIGMGRQFIAVVPAGLSENNEVKQLMGKLKRTVDARGQEMRWVPANHWHVTLQFLGDSPRGKQPLLEALQAWKPQVADISLRMHGLGAFPSNEEARVLWMGVQESQEFLSLQEHLAAHLSTAGFAMGDRDFKPHLTLARLRNTMNVADLVKLGGRKHFGDYPISECILFESVLQGNILKYTPIFRKSLV